MLKLVFLLIILGLQELFSKIFLFTPNLGFSLGLGSGGGIIVINFFVIILMFWWYLRKKSLGLFLIITGGLVNLLDRLRLGYVRDYWNLPRTGLKNNLADWLIFTGMIVMIWNLGFWWKKKNI